MGNYWYKTRCEVRVVSFLVTNYTSASVFFFFLVLIFSAGMTATKLYTQVSPCYIPMSLLIALFTRLYQRDSTTSRTGENIRSFVEIDYLPSAKTVRVIKVFFFGNSISFVSLREPKSFVAVSCSWYCFLPWIFE